MIADADKENRGEIDFPGFLEVMTPKILLERDPMQELHKMFKLFDEDETGKISFKNLRKAARELGENLSDEEI